MINKNSVKVIELSTRTLIMDIEQNVCLSVPVKSFKIDDLDDPENVVRKVLEKGKPDYLNKNQRLQTLNLFITEKCNLSCPFCCMESDRKKDNYDILMPDKLGENFLEFIRKVNPRKIIISGGEPFTNSHIDSIIDMITSTTNSMISIQSNGFLLTDESIEYISGKVKMLEISTSHYGNNFDRLEHIVRKAGKHGIGVALSYMYDSSNYEGLYKVLDLSNKYKTVFLINFVSPEGSALDHNIRIPESVEKLNVLFNIAKYMIQKGYREAGMVHMFFSPVTVQQSCGAYKKSMTIFPDGNVYPCHSIKDPQFLIGNIYNDNPEHIQHMWKEQMENQEIKQLFSLEGKGICKECKLKDICGGMCGAHIYRGLTGDCTMRKAMLLFNILYFNRRKTIEQNLTEFVTYIDEKKYLQEIVEIEP